MAEQDEAQSSLGSKGPTGGPATDPITQIVAEHALQLKLCDTLEFIADGLPDAIDRRLVREVIAILQHGLEAHFKAEEQHLFPLLRRRASGEPSVIAALAQLEAEHHRDVDISAELLDELGFVAEHGRARNAEMLGYMLRGFFEGQRRHIAWENAVVVPAARRLLNDDDLRSISAALERTPARLSDFGQMRPRA